MKYLSTVEQEFQEYLDTFVNVEPYTELLNVSIRGSKLVLLFKGDYNCTNPHNNYEEKKSFTFKVVRGDYINNLEISENFEYHSTIRRENDDHIEYYNIFYEERKTLDELRDDKLNDIIDEDF
jgi:hypothetical protein